jgi:hypothetical protein
MERNELPDASPQDIARGCMQSGDRWICLICHNEFEAGAVYEINGRLYEANRAALEHVKAEHGSVFLHLLRTQSKYTGLTQHQANVLERMAAGHSDKQIAQALAGNENSSSIRNLRFQLKERERQARAFLALMEAFRSERGTTGRAKPAQAHSHTGAALTDERFDSTERERSAVLKVYLAADGKLKDFPVREKRKIIVLQHIAGRFDAKRVYSEKEVNEVIAYHDFATVRRYLVEYGFLQRSQDCRRYWVKEAQEDADQ